ncbi:integral membrane sensor signal transduction histidine kinase [Enterobacterales bacterium CwR94]|nr:integral membrane sensor signal transduction histidine kinase [Enterobacterales bacterium CwR94]
MKRLTDFPMYLQIFAAVTAALLTVVLCTIALWFWLDDNNRHESAFATFAEMMEQSLPAASASRATQAAAIDDWMQRTHTRFALYRADGELLSRPLSPALPFPQQVTHGGYFDDWNGTRFVWVLKDSRVLVLQFSSDRATRPWLFIGMVIALTCAVAGAAFLVIRRLTRRLERLQHSVESLGKGDLRARVTLSGDDEVGRLAVSFNRSATQIEQLVHSQKNMLAYASHELRAPLTRIQMASALSASPNHDELQRSVAELDALVEEILLMSRLENPHPDMHTAFDLTDITAIAAEECAVAGVELAAEHVFAEVDARLWRRLLRNLIENALRHGRPPVRVNLQQHGGTVHIAVEDSGPGLPVTAIPRLFEPFYRLPQARSTAGTGLGLALVKAIATHHQGEVSACNTATRGACFTFRFPWRRATPVT